jgi:hypothetical protein
LTQVVDRSGGQLAGEGHPGIAGDWRRGATQQE